MALLFENRIAVITEGIEIAKSANALADKQIKLDKLITELNQQYESKITGDKAKLLIRKTLDHLATVSERLSDRFKHKAVLADAPNVRHELSADMAESMNTMLKSKWGSDNYVKAKLSYALQRKKVAIIERQILAHGE